MLNVMLVDDNKSLLEGLAFLIEWEEYGYRIEFSASNYHQAIEALENHKIDLIITDIRMPRMTGFDLINYVKEKELKIKFVLISGYSKFDYAKWAIDYRINGYLLKPIDENELIEVIKRIKVEIEQERVYLNRQLNYYVHNALIGENQYTNKLEMVNQGSKLRYCFLRIYSEKFISSNNMQYNIECINNIYNKIVEIAGVDREGYIIKNHFGEIEIIIDNKMYDGDIRAYLRNLENAVSEVCDEDFAIMVGKALDNIEDIRISKQSVKHLENCVFYNMGQRIFLYDDCKDKKFTGFLSDNTTFEKLIYAIKNLEKEDVLNAVEDFLADIEENRISAEHIFTYIGNIIFEIGNTVVDSKGEVVKYMYRSSLLKKNQTRFASVAVFLKENAIEMWEMVSEAKSKNVLGIITSVIDYINENYSDNTTRLQTIASKYYINASYLGMLFKEKTGVSFNTYLTNIRIEKAKELLTNTNYKIYEIAHMVGFIDPNYFSVKFAEKEKITSAQFRRQKQQKNK